MLTRFQFSISTIKNYGFDLVRIDKKTSAVLKSKSIDADLAEAADSERTDILASIYYLVLQLEDMNVSFYPIYESELSNLKQVLRFITNRTTSTEKEMVNFILVST